MRVMVTGPASSAENGDPAARPPARLPLNSSPTASHRRTGRCLICPSPSLPSAGRARAGGSTRWTLPSIGGIGRRRRSRGSVISWRRSGPPSRLKTRRRAHGQISPSCWPQSAVNRCAARQHGRSALEVPSRRAQSSGWGCLRLVAAARAVTHRSTEACPLAQGHPEYAPSRP